MFNKSENGWVTPAAIFAAALGARLAFTLAHGPAPLIAEMNAYWDAAGGLLAGAGFHAGHGFRAFIPPGYAFFLAAVRGLGGTPLTARIFQDFLGAGTALMLFYYVRRPFGPKTALYASMAFAIWPPSLAIGDFVLTESLFTFLLMAMLFLWGDGGNWKRAIGAGLLGGAAALSRELALFFFPIIALSNILTREHKRALNAILAGIVVIACVAPWTTRNWRVLGGFIPITTKSNVDFYIYNHNTFDQILHNESDQPGERRLFADATSEIGLGRLAQRRALDWIVAHPALFIFKGLRTEANFFGLERDFFQHQQYGYFPPLPRWLLWLLVPIFLVPSAAALPLAFIGALRFGRNPNLKAATAIVILYVVITFAAYSFTRQRYPLTPFIIAFAVGALASGRETWDWLRGRPRRWIPAAACSLFLIASWTLELYLDLKDFAATG
jgi:4-amino-4-deoxy-L-arabinose transferase-like glycosyltransferase